MARLFGTDGVRGVANEELTPLLAMQLGQAGAYVLTKERDHKPTIMSSPTKPASSTLPITVGIALTPMDDPL